MVRASNETADQSEQRIARLAERASDAGLSRSFRRSHLLPGIAANRRSHRLHALHVWLHDPVPLDGEGRPPGDDYLGRRTFEIPRHHGGTTPGSLRPGCSLLTTHCPAPISRFGAVVLELTIKYRSLPRWARESYTPCLGKSEALEG